MPQSVAAAAVESGDWSAFRVEVLIDENWHVAVFVARGQPLLDTRDRDYDAQGSRRAAIRIVS